jgi:catechol 2,3-dioxygenase-like lactoylglutathione lyase family enzyme
MAIEFTRLNHVTLNAPAGQHEKVRWFYGKVLGLKEVPTPQALEAYYDLIWFEIGDFLIHIDFAPPFFKATDNRHLCLEVKEIAAVRRELEEKGAEIHDAIAIPGRDRFFVVDPFGNYFELLEMHSPIP